jgi:ketosteroid isomerase-like protein
MSRDRIERYFDAFNRNDIAGMLDCLDEQVAHHVNEGSVRVGRGATTNL